MSEFKDPFSQYLLSQFSKAIFLNKNLDIFYIHGDLESVLSFPNAIAKLNLEKMMSQNDLLFFLNGVRTALDEPKLHRFDEVVFRKKDSNVMCNLTFQAVELADVKEDVVLVTFDFFEENPPQKQEVVQHQKDDFDNYILQLEKELKASRQRIKFLETDQKKQLSQFNSKNRELSIGNEELQSTNEELQSVNEELHTVNAELQHKNAQLSIVNNDINNLLKATNIGTVFLDEELKIRKFTPAIKKQFSIVDSDIGRSITSFTHNIKYVDIEAVCKNVFEEGEPIIKLVSNHAGYDFLFRVFPYRTLKDKIEGVVIAVIDLSKTKTLLQKYDKSIQEMAHKFDAIFKYSKDAMLFLDGEGRITSVNEAFKKVISKKVIGELAYKFLEENQAEGFKKVFEKVIKTHDSQNHLVEYKDSPTSPVLYFRLHLIPIPDRETKQVRMVNIIAQQITQEVNYQKALEEVKDTFMGFMEKAQHQMILLDKSGKIIHINTVLYSSYKIEDIIGKSVYGLLPPDELSEFKKPIEEVFAGKPNNKFSFKYTNTEGIERFLTLVATPVIVRDKIAYVALVGEPL